MVAALLDAGIPASRISNKDGTQSVTVEKANFARAVEMLDRAGLPTAKFATLDQVFKSGGLVPSPMEERARMIFALSEELSHTISEIDGVLSARVHIVLPENDPLRGSLSPSSASVFIRHAKDSDIDSLIPQIKSLVANSVAGLSYDRVSVVPIASQVALKQLAEPTGSATAFGMDIPKGNGIQVKTTISVLVVLCLGLLGWSFYLLRSRKRERIFALSASEID